MYDTVKQRIIHFLESIKMSKAEFGRRIGVSSAFITSMRQSIQPDKIKSIALNFPELNTDWLMTGEGEMLKQSIALQTEPAGDFYTTMLLPISAQAGSLNDFVMSIEPGDCERVISPIKNVDFAIPVAGDSMQPEYPNGSQILVKRINTQAFIEWGKVYVLDTCNGTIVKEVRKDDDEEFVVCYSRNPDPKYQPFRVAFADIYGMYRVLMCMSLK